jgi:hypothetical protein
MTNEVLRDVLAGCAGVLAVAAIIGLPRASAPVQQQAPAAAQRIVLLPYVNFSRVGPPAPAAPVAPHARITTGP